MQEKQVTIGDTTFKLEKPFLDCFDRAFKNTRINEHYLKKLMLVVNNPDVKNNLLQNALIQQAKADGIIDYFEYIQIFYVYTNYYSNYAIYFNVEQGNMAFIRYKGTNIVVDMGSTKENLASSILLNYLVIYLYLY